MINVLMPDGSVQQYTGVSVQFNYAMEQGGVPIRSDGTPYQVSQFLPNVGEVPIGTAGAGFLFDGCPANVENGQGWVPGQMTALQEQGIDCQTSKGGGQCSCCPGGIPSGSGPHNWVNNGGSIVVDPNPISMGPMDNARRIINLTRRNKLNTLSY